MDIQKIALNTVQEVASEVKIDKVAKNISEQSQEIADSIVDEVAAKALTLQGKSLVKKTLATRTADAIKKKCPDGKLADARSVVKKAPLPKGYKKEVISEINAEIESRYWSSKLTGVPEEKWVELCENSPKAKRAKMEARKEGLQECFGDALVKKKKKQLEAIQKANLTNKFNIGVNRNSSILERVMMCLRPDIYTRKTVCEIFDEPKLKKQLDILKKEGQEKGSAVEFLNLRTSAFLKQLSDKELLELKTKYKQELFEWCPNEEIKHFFESVNAELELRHVGISSGKIAEESAQVMERYASITDDMPIEEVMKITGKTRKEVLQDRFGIELAAKKEQAFLDSKLANISEEEVQDAFASRDVLLHETYGSINEVAKKFELTASQAKKYVALKEKFPQASERDLMYATRMRNSLVELMLKCENTDINEALNSAYKNWNKNL